MLKFITGNKGKFLEASFILSPIKLKQVEIDLDEIQELDAHKILRHKLKEALKHHQSNFIIEDTSVYYQSLKNKLPGPLMKWFLYALGNKELHKLAKQRGSTKARMQTLIAYQTGPKKVYFFEGTVKGKIVQPKGRGGFGVDKIFKPNGHKLTQAQMSEEEKSKCSSRSLAFGKLKNYILKNEKR